MKYKGPKLLRLSGLGVERLNSFRLASMNSAAKGERAPSLLFYVPARRTHRDGGRIAFNLHAADALRVVEGVNGATRMVRS